MAKSGMHRLIVSVFFAFVLFLSGRAPQALAQRGGNPTLTALAGAQLSEPFEKLAALYEKKTGVKVRVILNNCGFLFGRLLLSREGDIFMAGSRAFVEKAKKAGIAAEVTGPLAYQVPVIVTPRGNPAHIKDVRDLAGPGVTLLLPDTKTTAIGMDAAKVFDKLGIGAGVKRNTIAYLATPSQALAALLMGQGNAAVVSYSTIVKAGGKIHVVPVDPRVNVVDAVHCVVLSFSKHPGQAREFAAFLEANAPRVFAAYGFQAGR